MSKWSLLAAHQALSIYIMVRLCEGENEYNNLDVLLLGTVAVRLLPTFNTSSSLD